MSSEVRFNLNMLDLEENDIGNILFIAMKDGVPKRYRLTAADVASVAETTTTVYHRGVTQKSDGTPLNVGVDDFSLPAGWQNMKRLVILGDYAGVRKYIWSWNISDFASMGFTADEMVYFYSDVGSGSDLMTFNPVTGAFGTESDNERIERILLVG